MARTSSAPSARSLPPLRPQQRLDATDTALARILGAIEEYVYIGEFRPGGDYRVVFAGPCREQFLGMDAESARTAVWADHVHPDDVEVFDAGHERARTGGRLDLEYRLVGADGVVRWVRDRGRVRSDGGRHFLDGSILDVTAVHAAHSELEAARARADRLAHTDDLTGVPNRRGLAGLLARSDGVSLGVLSVDVDRFKLINDLHGHATGDVVLAAVAVRLSNAMRRDDQVVRMGGEEFLVLLPGVCDLTALHALAEALRRAVGATPVLVGTKSLGVTVSIGAACASVARDVDALLATADRLLYAAKRAGRDRVHVAPLGTEDDDDDDDESTVLRLARATALTAAAAAASPVPEEHRLALAALAGRTARRMGLQRPQVLRCRLGALLCDVGLVAIPAARLPEAVLGPAERAELRRHPELGERLVAAVAELAAVAPIVRHHHEHHDGTGYPDGLAGESVPVEARIVAATVTALAGPDPLAALDAATGTRLDPRVVAAAREALQASALDGAGAV